MLALLGSVVLGLPSAQAAPNTGVHAGMNLKFLGDKSMKSSFPAIFRTNSAALRSARLSVLFIFSFVLAQTAKAATITVNSLSDAIAGDGQCTLREAMTNANADNQSPPTLAPPLSGILGCLSPVLHGFRVQRGEPT